MRDKELREQFEKFKKDLMGLKWDSESASYNGSVLGKMSQSIKNIEHDLKYEYVMECVIDPDKTITGKVKDLERSMKEVLENQKLIIEYLGIEKVEEPPKTFYRKKKDEKEKSGSKLCSCK